MSTIPIYRAAEPFTAQFQAVTKSGPTTTKIDVEKTIEAYPEPMRPWKPDDLKGVKILLPLGEGESIDDKLYRFTVAWEEEPTWEGPRQKPLRISDFRFHDESVYREKDDDRSAPKPEVRFLPIESAKASMIRCKFEFKPIRFRPLDFSGIDFSNIKDQTAPKPEFLGSLVIHTAQMKILVNDKNEGFNVHFSRDGKKWYGVQGGVGNPWMPTGLLPYEALYVRIATEKGREIKKFSLDFEAILETHGFRGTGETIVGDVNRGTGERKKEIDCPWLLLDGSGNLHMILDNREDEPLQIGSWLSHNFRSRSRFGGVLAAGAFSSDGFHVGPTIPAKSLGIYTMKTADDQPGEHSYIFSIGHLGFHLRFLIPETDRMGPNPPPGFSRITIEGEENKPRRNDEYKPEDKTPFVTFDDGFPTPTADIPVKP